MFLLFNHMVVIYSFRKVQKTVCAQKTQGTLFYVFEIDLSSFIVVANTKKIVLVDLQPSWFMFVSFTEQF